MHLGLSELLDFYRAHRSDEALVLGTVAWNPTSPPTPKTCSQTAWPARSATT
jgi:hypothetical protein